MNDTLSTPDPAQQVAEVRHIIENRGHHTCEAVLLRIRRVVDPPPAEPRPIEHDRRGWPKLHSSEWEDTGSGPGYGGAAWERHDDPEADE